MSEATACGGLTVIDFSQGMAGPMATMILADHGADVVKVESPRGDFARGEPGFLMWNRGKRSVVLDLTRDEDRVHALALAETADVVVNPRVVYSSITGYGRDDPRSQRRTYEVDVAATVGRMVGLDLLSGAI